MNCQGAISAMCHKAVASVVLLSVLLALSACSRHDKPIVQKVALGGFRVDAQGTSVESTFRITDNVTNSTLGFEVRGIPLDATFWPEFRRIVDGLSSGGLRLQLQFFAKDSTNDFYCASFPLGRHAPGAAHGVAANFVYSGQRVKDYPVFFFEGIKPLGVYGESELQGNTNVVYHSQKNVFSQDGMLLAGIDYRVRLTVGNGGRKVRRVAVQ